MRMLRERSMPEPAEPSESREGESRSVDQPAPGAAAPSVCRGWLLLVGIVLVFGFAGFCTPRLFRPFPATELQRLLTGMIPEDALSVPPGVFSE